MRRSAGILLYRKLRGVVEVMLVHPGGPLWKGKDEHAWSIPKGEIEEDESPLDAAKREFKEEVGCSIKSKKLTDLGEVKTSSKHIFIWAAEEDFDISKLRSNTIAIEWPLHSGKMISIPEVDKAEWFPLSVAKTKVHKGQMEFISRLSVAVNER